MGAFRVRRGILPRGISMYLDDHLGLCQHLSSSHNWLMVDGELSGPLAQHRPNTAMAFEADHGEGPGSSVGD